MESRSTTQRRQHEYPGSSPLVQMDKARTLPPLLGMYLSPPAETFLDNFSAEVSPSPAQKKWETRLPPIQAGPSPPVSPETPPLPRIPALNEDASQHSHNQDPLLFPGSQDDSNVVSLFENDSQPTEPEPACKRLGLKQAVPTRPATFSDRLDAGIKNIFPQFRDFKIADDCYGYYQDNMAELARIPGIGSRRETAEPPVTETYTAAQKRLLQQNHGGVQKRSAAPRHHKTTTSRAAAQPTPTLEAATSTPAKPIAAPPRKTARAPTVPRDRASSSVEPQARKRAQPTKSGPSKAEDKDWAKIPDYCPPVSTLSKTRVLKVTWKSPPNDLDGDPDRQHMHDQEIEAAAVLKLPGAQYLANKRRIFRAKLNSLREGKTFTKTAAQQACNIDVNKTSQLYAAFDRCGWFDKGHFEQWV